MMTLEKALKLTKEAIEQMEWNMEPVIIEIDGPEVMGIRVGEDIWFYAENDEWVVEMGITYSNYPHSPDDYDVREIKRTKELSVALASIFEYYFDLMLHQMKDYISFKEEETPNE